MLTLCHIPANPRGTWAAAMLLHALTALLWGLGILTVLFCGGIVLAFCWFLIQTVMRIRRTSVMRIEPRPRSPFDNPVNLDE